MKKIVLWAFVLVLFLIPVVVEFIRPVQAQGTIYISADGSVVGTNKIQRDGNVYTFTGNINDSIIVEKDNIVVDGAGYTLQGIGSGIGIDLAYGSNTKIENMKIETFCFGISLTYSSNLSISGNTITNNDIGIALSHSLNNSISGNRITDNEWGIYLHQSTNNTVFENNITKNKYGIKLSTASNNIFYHNNFINNTQQVYDYSWGSPYFLPSINIWNNVYPSGGNYWSDYKDKYPDAQELDGSGIWDTPYIIDENNQDNYPIIPEFPTWTPILLMLIVLTVVIAIYKRRLLKTPTH